MLFSLSNKERKSEEKPTCQRWRWLTVSYIVCWINSNCPSYTSTSKLISQQNQQESLRSYWQSWDFEDIYFKEKKPGLLDENINMPFIFSERLPVPTVKSYCLLSGLIFAASLLYAKNIILEANENEEGKTNFYQSIQKIYLNDQFCLWVSQ